MKKLRYILLFCYLVPLRLFAQDTAAHHAYHNNAAEPHKGLQEVTVNCGLQSGRQLIYSLSGERGPVISSAMPVYYVSYRYWFFRTVALGLTLGTQTLGGNSSPENEPAPAYTFKETSITAAIEAKIVSWQVLNTKRNVQVYSLVGAGLSAITTHNTYAANATTSKSYPLNTQFTLLGIRFGKSFAGFAEIGFGYKGIISAGLSYHVRSSKPVVKS